MAKVNGRIGRSAETALKLRQIKKVLPLGLNVTKRALGQWGGRLRLIDLNAASGRYEFNGEEYDGSALIMADFADGLDIPWQVILIEAQPVLVEQLRHELVNGPYRRRHEGYAACLPQGQGITVQCGDNRILAPTICAAGSSRDRGLVLFDANGEPDFDLAAKLSALSAMRGVDFLIHVPTWTLKMIRAAALSERFSGKGEWATRDIRRLDERIAPIQKAHWMIRTPYGKCAWTFLYGTNYRLKNGWAKEGFYWIDTPEGRDLLLKLSVPERERCRPLALLDSIDAAGGD